MTPHPQFPLIREIKPSADIREPDVWFQELRLLRRFSIESDALIRRIELKPGLNILWSPAEDSTAKARLYQESWGGHAAGKTLFCRILRYLLGDSNFRTIACRLPLQVCRGIAVNPGGP